MLPVSFLKSYFFAPENKLETGEEDGDLMCFRMSLSYMREIMFQKGKMSYNSKSVSEQSRYVIAFKRERESASLRCEDPASEVHVSE